MTRNVIKARDTISAKKAECFMTIGGNRYHFANMIDFEASIEKKKEPVPRLGSVMEGHKTTGLSGVFSGTMHYIQSITRQMLIDYKDTGIDSYFEIQVTNDDPESAAGRQTINLYECNTDGGILTKFDANGEILDESVEGTFEDFKMPESFRLVDEMN